MLYEIMILLHRVLVQSAICSWFRVRGFVFVPSAICSFLVVISRRLLVARMGEPFRIDSLVPIR
jgi:hypothetical protein